MNSIELTEQQFIEDYNEVGDWFLQLQMMLELIDDTEPVPEEERTEENRISSCQSLVWVDCSDRDGRVFVREYSEALIIRAILAVYAWLVNGRSASEVAGFEPRFVKDTTIKEQLNTDRVNGFELIVKKVREFAGKMEEQQKLSGQNHAV